MRQTSPARISSANGATKVPVSGGDSIEEVVIPAGIGEEKVLSDAAASNSAVVPIEKQPRRLTPYELAENAFRRGVVELRRARVREAEQQFRAAIREDRSHGAAQSALVGLLIDSGRLADAESVLQESIAANPRQPAQAKILARLQVERGDLQAAIETLNAALAYAESDAEYRAFLAAVLQRAQRHELAVSEYRSALALGRQNPIWLMGLGISLRGLGEYQQASEAFHTAGASKTLPPGLQAFVDQQYAELQRAAN